MPIKSTSYKYCKHDWVPGFADNGLSILHTIDAEAIAALREIGEKGLAMAGYETPMHCVKCFLEKYRRDNHSHYNHYWQQQLALNEELTMAYYRQLNEASAPMNWQRFLLFWFERAILIGEPAAMRYYKIRIAKFPKCRHRRWWRT